MRAKTKILMLAGCAFAMLVQPVYAYDGFYYGPHHHHRHYPRVGYVPPAPVYYAPAPVYYEAPPQPYYYPQPVYQPVYQPAPVAFSLFFR